jgi:hypothetical protein
MRRVIWYVATEQAGEELALIVIFVYTGRSLLVREERTRIDVLDRQWMYDGMSRTRLLRHVQLCLQEMVNGISISSQ